MTFKKRLLLPIFLSFLIFAPIVYALTSSNFLPKVQKYINNTCGKKYLTNDQSLFCYLFYKVQEHDKAISDIQNIDSTQNKQITDIQNQNASLEAALSDLQKRVTKLEATPSPTPTPFVIKIATNELAPASHTFSVQQGFKTMTFHVSSTESVVGWAVGASFDNGSTYHEEQRFGCGGTTCPDETVPILTDKVNFGTGSSNGNVTSSVALNPEPDAQILLLGKVISYPFTSQSFSTDGFATITITAGGGDNPQHVTGLSLQRFENGSFVEKLHIVCDGGDTCPVQTLPVLGGTYQVVMEGNGTSAVLGAILRK